MHFVQVWVNCAASLDGRIGAPDGSPLLLSGKEDLVRTHEMRSAADAILVGAGTVVADDPALRVKPELAGGDDPMRVVLDTYGRCPATARVFDGTAPTLVLHGPGAVPAGGESAEVPLTGGRLSVQGILAELSTRGVHHLMVEGGAAVIQSFFDADVVDRWTLYQAPVLLGAGPSLPPRHPFGQSRVEPLGQGVLWTFTP